MDEDKDETQVDSEDDREGSNGDGGDGNDTITKDITPMYGDHTPTPPQIMVLPIMRRPIFPGFLAAIIVKDEKTADGITALAARNSGFVGLFMRKDQITRTELKLETSQDLITSEDEIHKVGTFAQIQNVMKTSQGTQIILVGHRRVMIDEFVTLGPPAFAKVTYWKRPPYNISSTLIKAYSNEVVTSMKELFKVNPIAQEHVSQWTSRMEFSDPYKLADLAASITTAEGSELQTVLEAFDAEERLSLSLNLLRKELDLAKIQQEISKQVEVKISKQQRDYFLREQLKSIKQELGIEKEDKDDMVAKFTEQIEGIKDVVHSDVMKVMRSELEKISSLERNSPEFNVTRSYLEWLTCLPWGMYSTEDFNLKHAGKVLDEDHYGLLDIKKRILEYIAVGKLKGSVVGKIICFVGPPGVGKTSIAKSIAEALNRKFYRFSVGGLTDIAEIKGHRRTYIGAMPGKPILCLKSTGTSNPLILIDEIDKLGRGYSGDPASALLELLDPNQNTNFVDHYLDVPVDFSKVLFVCTANDESAIPGPLKDRMEMIRLSGYDIPEKVAIASRYLIPKALSETGIGIVKCNYQNAVLKHYGIEDKVEIEIPEDSLKTLIRNYCRESGVRSLEKQIEKIVRKVVFDYMAAQEEKKELGVHKVNVTLDKLEYYLGKPKYPNETLYANDGQAFPPGIVMGLAWNPLGGTPIYIETTALPVSLSDGATNVNIVTGQLGSVMKESVNIAYTFARQLLAKFYPVVEEQKEVQDNNGKDDGSISTFFKRNQIHLHVPEGAIEKDGPSAGVAMTSALLSLAMNKPIRPRTAMTGELSLTGKVLPVGGIKEKTLAARRAGADTVLLPFSNKRDYDELPDYVKDSMTVHFCSDYHQVYQICFEYDFE